MKPSGSGPGVFIAPPNRRPWQFAKTSSRPSKVTYSVRRNVSSSPWTIHFTTNIDPRVTKSDRSCVQIRDTPQHSGSRLIEHARFRFEQAERGRAPVVGAPIASGDLRSDRRRFRGQPISRHAAATLNCSGLAAPGTHGRDLNRHRVESFHRSCFLVCPSHPEPALGFLFDPRCASARVAK
jgi:hypothetical protein